MSISVMQSLRFIILFTASHSCPNCPVVGYGSILPLTTYFFLLSTYALFHFVRFSIEAILVSSYHSRWIECARYRKQSNDKIKFYGGGNGERMKEQPTHSHHVCRRRGAWKSKRKQAQPAHRPTIKSFSDFILSRGLWLVPHILCESNMERCQLSSYN